MALTRRGALATMAAAGAASVTPASATSAGGSFRDSAVAARQSGGPAFRVEWDQVVGGEYGWHCPAIAPSGDGGVVALCNLLADAESSMATKLVEVTPSGELETIGTLGNPGYERRQYWYWDVEPGVNGGYVIAGYERQYSPYGSLTEVVPQIVHIGDGGEVQWASPVEGTPTTFQTARPTTVVAVGNRYVLASADYEGGVGTALAAYEPDGSRRWNRGYDTSLESGAKPVQLRRTADGVVLLAVRGFDDGQPTEPVLARLADDGTVADRVIPVVESDRMPHGFAVRDGRYLVVGAAPGDGGDSGWAMELPGFAATADWQGSNDAFGAGLTGAAGTVAGGGWVFAGQTGDGYGQVVGASDLSAPSLARTFDTASTYADVVPAGDGSAYVAGSTGSGAESQLVVTRVSTALDPDAVSTSVAPTTVAPGEAASLSIDVEGYDADLLSANWTVDGSPVASGFSGQTSFEETGEYTLVATITTEDDRSVSVEQTVTVGEDDGSSDGDGGGGMPGFGVVIGLLGLAGAAGLRSRRDD
ncbi:hypothetical protein L593_09330 [Salinarchaeum sp. Harcht-Bsk1]|uniref:PGF-CTERM sorting domain-containing protein n=1 Tax=Salinarchaeum sp. Harcht-Bsk1 TaxID=1333523 RepID=UPI0003423B2E|nr:PGF-CTERM sorting domain-containing protein [Salinarchaeum sp. Harcht-Bsk1]AGN01811.1 hypothetical protein L593_09330 [Salinarchaeum sp. Harcht-Bsk1]